SSDAVAALDGALEAWHAELDIRTRAAIAARLGSDVTFFLAGGAALVEGRGERVTPLRGIVGEAPGVLLVTPGMPLPTPAAYAAYDAGHRQADPGAIRAASGHLADEVGAGLTTWRLLDRAAVIASANDLIPAAISLVPGLVGLRRRLARLLGRPIAQSGAGPTLWALYPSLAEAAPDASCSAPASSGWTPRPGTSWTASRLRRTGRSGTSRLSSPPPGPTGVMS